MQHHTSSQPDPLPPPPLRPLLSLMCLIFLPSKSQIFTITPLYTLYTTHAPGGTTLSTLLLPSQPHHHIHPGPTPFTQTTPPTHTHSKTLSDPHSFPIDILSPPVFAFLRETSGQPASAAAAQTGGRAVKGRRGWARQSPPIPAPSHKPPPIAGAWSIQWGPNPH